MGRSQRTLRFQFKDIVNDINDSEQCAPTTTQVQSHHIISHGHQGFISEQLETESEIERTDWLNRKRFTKGSIVDIIRSLINNNAIAVSDGSYMENEFLGTSSWIITN